MADKASPLPAVKGRSARLGFICPPGASGNDLRASFLPRLLKRDVRALLLTVPGRAGEHDYDIHNLLRVGNPESLNAAAQRLADQGPRAAIWASTSGSFAGGMAWSNAQIRSIGQAAGCPASSTSHAFVDALTAIGVTSVAVAATYSHSIAERFADFLSEAGVTVRNLISIGLRRRAEAERISEAELAAAATKVAVKEAKAVLLPGISIATLLRIQEMERSVGKPVLTASQVSIWQALRLAGLPTQTKNLGILFDTSVPN